MVSSAFLYFKLLLVPNCSNSTISNLAESIIYQNAVFSPKSHLAIEIQASFQHHSQNMENLWIIREMIQEADRSFSLVRNTEGEPYARMINLWKKQWDYLVFISPRCELSLQILLSCSFSTFNTSRPRSLQRSITKG